MNNKAILLYGLMIASILLAIRIINSYHIDNFNGAVMIVMFSFGGTLIGKVITKEIKWR